MAKSKTEDSTAQDADTESELVKQVDDGVRIRSSITRGSGTRDEDDHTIEIERKTVEEALQDYAKVLAVFENEYLQRVRNLDPQPETDQNENT
jgi:hypothetical protein